MRKNERKEVPTKRSRCDELLKQSKIVCVPGSQPRFKAQPAFRTQSVAFSQAERHGLVRCHGCLPGVRESYGGFALPHIAWS